MASHMDGINKLPKWDPNNPLKYNYDPSNYDRADYAKFKQARLDFLSKQKSPSISELNKRSTKTIGDTIMKKLKSELAKLNAALDKTIKTAEDYGKPKKKSKASRAPEWDGDSTCFSDLEYDKDAGGVWATFYGPASGTWFYPMSASEARDWFSDSSVGGYFNDMIR